LVRVFIVNYNVLQLRQNQLHHEDEIMRLKEQISDAQRFVCYSQYQSVTFVEGRSLLNDVVTFFLKKLGKIQPLSLPG